jgi:hypothetical protein
MHILFVTPHLGDADLAERRLQRSAAGARVDACGVPDQARARILTVLYDAVVVDVLAFGESGLQLISECRARAPQQPVIALTRTAGEDDVVMAAVAGATTSIPKEGGWLEPLAEALLGDRPPVPTGTPATDAPAPSVIDATAPALKPPSPTGAPGAASKVNATTAPAAEPPARSELMAQLERLQHALDQEAAIRRDAEARARNLASAHDADRQRWQLALRQLEERYAAITQQQTQRSDIEAAFESVEQRYMALLEERRRDLRRLEVLEEQALRHREGTERLEAERDRLARDLNAAQAAQARAEEERTRLASERVEFDRRHRALDRQRAELETQLARATDDLRQAADHGAAIQAALARAERDQQEAHAQLEALRRRSESDAQALGERDGRLRQLEQAVEAALADARNARAELARQDGTGREARLASELAAAHAAARASESELAQVRGTVEALTAQREALEQRLRDATADRPARLDLHVVGVATTTRDGRLLRATDTFARACGFESAGSQLAADPRRGLPFLAAPEELARGLAAGSGPRRYEARLRDPDGRSRWVVATALPPETTGTDTVDWVLCDVTDTPLARHQQRRIRRLDAACALADSAGTALLERGGHATREDEAVLRQIVAYARQRGRADELTDLGVLFASSEATIQRLLGAGIDARIRPVPTPLLAEIDRAEAEGVLAGAVLAIREALPLGGRLTVTASAIDGEVAGARLVTVTPFARVVFTAEGHGVRAVQATASLQERLADFGGCVRTVHQPAEGTRLEVDVPMAVTLTDAQ